LATHGPLRPETEGPEVHNLRCSNVPVENATALAAVLALGQRLGSDDPALGARLRSTAWIDFHKLDPGTCNRRALRSTAPTARFTWASDGAILAGRPPCLPACPRAIGVVAIDGPGTDEASITVLKRQIE